MAIVGTFDVENYGDLLFPLIAAGELQRRDPSIEVVPFSVNAKSASDWPYAVKATGSFAQRVPEFAAVLVGGGQIVRYDDTYPVPAPPGTKMPIDYWLVPALVGAMHAKPIFWNGVGAWTHSPDAPWLRKPLQEVLAASRFIGIRDEASLQHLRRMAPGARLEFLPDTAFGLSRLWPLGEETEEYARWRESLGVEGAYAVVQASPSMLLNRDAIERQLRSMNLAQVVVLPVCWCHGDRADQAPDLTGKVIPNHAWLPPRLISEIIARSEFVFASSLHACITAISYGVPAARAAQYTDRKFELLENFEGLVSLSDEAGLARLSTRGKRVEPRAEDYADRLATYWDRVASAVSGAERDKDDAARLRMVRLFTDLCDDQRGASSISKALARAQEPVMFLKRRQIYFRNNLLILGRRTAAAVRRVLPRAKESPAYPFPDASEEVADSGARGGVLNMAVLERAAIADEPYRWAFIDELFSPDDALKLARTFPRDRFRRVAGYDGEKGYEYLSRSLVHMGAREATAPEGLSPQWRALVADLLSDEYRDAMSRASGLDLTQADMEVNAIRFGPGAWLGPHVDLKEKIATHILYFNEAWDAANGGCLEVLSSRDDSDRVAEILPLAGNSALLVRSDRSWHAVSRVAKNCKATRKNINVIFHLPGSISTMWPPGEKFRLKTVPAADEVPVR